MWTYGHLSVPNKYGGAMISHSVDKSCCFLMMLVKRRSSGWLLHHFILYPWFCLPNRYILQVFLEEPGFNIYSLFFSPFPLHALNFPRYFGPTPHVVNLVAKYCSCRLPTVVFPHHPICEQLSMNMLLPTNKKVTLQYNRPISFQVGHVWHCSENNQHFWMIKANPWEHLTPQELQSNCANDT